MKKLMFVVSVVGLLAGCGESTGEQEYLFDFREGAQQWQGGFADYPVEDAANYQLEQGIKPMPTGYVGSGYMLKGNNHSDSLFMFVQRKISGLMPNSRYELQAAVRLASNAGTNCTGVGGAPGEAVYVKFGVHDSEPKQVGFYLNADKGDQSQDGMAARVTGHIGVQGLGCTGQAYGSKVLPGVGKTPLYVTTNSAGEVWVFIGTDSGYEGVTSLYLQTLQLLFIPK